MGDLSRNKFDKLANGKRKAGNPKWPDDVYMDKQLAKQIYESAYSSSLGFCSDDDGLEQSPPVQSNNTETALVYNGGRRASTAPM